MAAPRTWDELLEPDLRHLELPEVLERLRGGLDPLSALHSPPAAAAISGAVTPASGPSVRRTRPPAVAQRSHRASPMRRTKAGATTLPAGLAGPIAVELARAAERIPGPHAMPGGSRYEPKWDGFRGSLQIGNGSVRLWSKNGTDFCR